MLFERVEFLQHFGSLQGFRERAVIIASCVLDTLVLLRMRRLSLNAEIFVYF